VQWILDCGTWGLHARGQGYGGRHFEGLAEYYRQHEARWRVAPDEYLRPDRTLENWRAWLGRFPDVPVVPVVQYRREGRPSADELLKQLEVYAAMAPAAVFISNPGMKAGSWLDHLAWAVGEVKRAVPGAWVHVLGAGWDPVDVVLYRRVPGLDSIDSIAYYTDARDGIAWRIGGKGPGRPDGCPCPACAVGTPGWQAVAMHNAWVALQVLRL
jgi:hypothetical protein